MKQQNYLLAKVALSDMPGEKLYSTIDVNPKQNLCQIKQKPTVF